MRQNCSATIRCIVVVAGYARSLVNFRGPLIQAFLEAGLEVHAAAPNLSEDAQTREQLQTWGVVTHDVPLQRTGINPIHDLGAIRAFYRLFRTIQPDAVLGYTIKPVIYATLVAWLTKVPRRYVLITGLGYVFSGEATNKRALVFKLVRRLYGMALCRTHHVMFQNSDDQELFRELNILPYRVPSTVVNGSGVDISYYNHTALPPAPIAFLLTARLIAEKGVRLYAEAATRLKARHPSVTFFLVGGFDINPGSIKSSELDEWVASGAIEYLGKLSDVIPALANSHVFVLPTYYREGVPRTILEALSMGRPIITTDSSGCRDTVEEGRNGFLVPVKNVGALESAMEKFITQPECIVPMGARSREIAEEKYDVHKVNEVMLSVMGVSAPDYT